MNSIVERMACVIGLLLINEISCSRLKFQSFQIIIQVTLNCTISLGYIINISVVNKLPFYGFDPSFLVMMINRFWLLGSCSSSSTPIPLCCSVAGGGAWLRSLR